MKHARHAKPAKRDKRRSDTRIASVAKITALAVIGLLLGLNLYLANASYLLGNKLPMPFGWGAAVVLSGSMEPTLSVNDLVFAQSANNYSTGDIVVFQSGNNLVMHRVIEVNGNTVTTQGDANNVADEPVSTSDIKGVVRGWIPGAGMIVNAAKTPLGVLVVIALAVLLEESSLIKKRIAKQEELNVLREEIKRLRAEEQQKGGDGQHEQD